MIQDLKDVKTVNDAFLLVSGRGNQTVWQWMDKGGAWKPITASEMYGRVRALAAAFAAWGVAKGDRVALISENRWEWQTTDFAAMALGAIDVPLYPTLTAEQTGYMLRDSGAKVAVVSTRALYDKVRAAGDLPALEHLVVMDEIDAVAGNQAETPFARFRDLIATAPQMQSRDPEFDARVRAAHPDDLATIIYTSGTTGEPKGVMLTHGNLACNFTLSTQPFGFSEKDSCISYLPLSHVTARHEDYALMVDGATLAYCPKIGDLAPAMAAVRPTIFVAVPRVLEKIRQGIERKSGASPMKKRIFTWALRVGKRHRQTILQGKQPWSPIWKLADKLVYSKIREAFGGRVGTFFSGGAPLGMDTAAWFADAGIRIFEGFGLTETSPVVALNIPNRHRIGTVGPILSNVQIRIAEDGELEVNAPSVFKGYWNKPQETAASFTPDGWFLTGDIAKLEDGFLSITDRKKELLKTSGGKFIAPQPIENKLKANLLVSNAALLGDKHKFVSVLISPNLAALGDWAKANGIATGDHATLVKDAKVVAEYKRIVATVNATLAPFEYIKRIAVVPDEWSVETDELTPSMKLKRRVVEKKYTAEIADFYKDEASTKD
jgi:long-chain acyl-CoA synthetase